MKDPLASLTASRFGSVSWGNSSGGTTFCLPRLPPDLPGRTSSFPCSTTKLIIPERAVKLNHPCTCNAANVLESVKIKATLLINLYFYIPCSWKIQLKHYIDLSAENDCHSEDRIRRHPKQGSSKNGIDREKRLLQLFYFSHWGGKGWPNSIGRSERLLLGLPSSVTDS